MKIIVKKNKNETVRIIDGYEVYFGRRGKKRSAIFDSEANAISFRNRLRMNKRKFLGMRPVRLAEVEVLD